MNLILLEIGNFKMAKVYFQKMIAEKLLNHPACKERGLMLPLNIIV